MTSGTQQPGRLTRPREPLASVVLAFTCAWLALMLLFYGRLAGRFGLDTGWLLTKEGALEQFTFMAELAGAALLATAARHVFKETPSAKWSANCYLLGALLLFVVGMEEIGWGQQLFGFATPEGWAAINHQQETTLHNLLNRDILTRSARWAAYAFTLLALLASTKFVYQRHSLLLALAPSASLAPMAVVIGIAGVMAHPEIIELFIAGYAFVYCYQVLQRVRAATAATAASAQLVNVTSVDEAESSPQAAKRIFITGASGFIGSRLSLYAHERGYEVVATGLARTSAERRRIEEFRQKGIHVHECTFLDAAALDELIAGCDAVIHLAAAQHEVNVQDAYFFDVNVDLTRKLLDACVRTGVKRFVYGSTIGVYGQARNSALTEESPLDPQNPYGKSKARAEQVVLQYGDRVASVVVRISETYGPGDLRLLKVYKAIAKGLFVRIGSGDNKRQPIHVRDLARGLLLATQHPRAVGQTFVFAGPEVLTTSEFLKTVQKALGNGARIWPAPLWLATRAADAIEAICVPLGVQPPLHRRRLDFFLKSFWFDTSKARTVLGFEPAIPFAHGAAETAHWYRAEGFISSSTRRPRPVVNVSSTSASDRPWQYSEILEFTHDAIIIWEMAGRGIVYWNRAAELLYGYHRSEAVGCITHELLRTKAKGGVEHLEAQLSRFGVWGGELQHVAKDGRRVLVQARLALMGQQNGRLLVLEVNRDLNPMSTTGVAAIADAHEFSTEP